ncbi:MAG TPA: UDP-N-acetylglucosamine 2-epimerase (non-hydrolyzing) [Candidatus Angelobacter sp.]|nr:UDP-N-acetylglucosamine 2-epimerase (non-hydrolyzing) [Candidatus Angelobacter sp.]
MKLAHVVGARPNFMKAAPVLAAIRDHIGCQQLLVHTGQHYHDNMSEIFFRHLGLPPVDLNLEVGSGSHAAQTAKVMLKFEEFVLQEKPDLVIVYGDVNSTIAAALVCAKLNIQVAHVEAGLRAFDRSMPEEINRILTDRISSYMFTPSQDANDNLVHEGTPPERIFLVGNVMIDTLVKLLPVAQERWPDMPAILDLPPGQWHDGEFGLITLHRPSNVDDIHWLERIVKVLEKIAERLPILFAVHPRTRERIGQIKFSAHRLIMIDPVGYLDFLALQQRAKFVITDSGGIQEETTWLGKPCFTLRENTERPITVTIGTNMLVGRDLVRLESAVSDLLRGKIRPHGIPPLWDGKAAERIAQVLSSEQSLQFASAAGHEEWK